MNLMENNTEYYISKGLDKETAEYFASGRKHIIKVTPNSDFTLTLVFDNGEIRLYDAKPLLQKGTVFEPLINWSDFRRVYLDECGCVALDIDPNIDSNKVWSNKIDLCSDACYIEGVPINP